MRFHALRCAAIRHDASTYMYGRIVTDRNGKHEKRIRVGRGKCRLVSITGKHFGITNFCFEWLEGRKAHIASYNCF